MFLEGGNQPQDIAKNSHRHPNKPERKVVFAGKDGASVAGVDPPGTAMAWTPRDVAVKKAPFLDGFSRFLLFEKQYLKRAALIKFFLRVPRNHHLSPPTSPPLRPLALLQFSEYTADHTSQLRNLGCTVSSRPVFPAWHAYLLAEEGRKS